MRKRTSRSPRAKRTASATAFSLFILLIAGVITPAFAQRGKRDTVLAKYDASIKIVTSLWDIDTIKPHKRHVTAEKLSANKINGEDKYIKKKQSGKKYAKFQAYDLHGVSTDELASSLVTNSLNRVTRYEEKGKKHRKGDNTRDLDELDNNKKSAPNEIAKGAVSVFKFKDKYFLIIGKNDYRYVDGKKLVGGQKMIDALMEGKPITETTFFYELKNAGVIDKGMTASKFMKLSIGQIQNLLHPGAVAMSL